MRIATYNVEWFDQLFGNDGRLLDDDHASGRQGVTRADQIAALGRVFRRLDADAVMVVEAPDLSRRRDGAAALEGFAAHFGLRARATLAGFANDTQQELILLYDPDRIAAAHDPRDSATAPRFDGAFAIDLDLDGRPEPVTWSKPPLEAQLTWRDTGRALRLIGVHAKSKAPIGARDAAHALRLSIANRRKQLAQCIWLRARVVEHLARGEDLIVLGDFNDGPGIDLQEQLFGRSSVEIVLGEGDGPQLFDPHAREALASRIAAQPSTARFYLAHEKRYLAALLDYVMVSEGLRAMGPRWRIWHPFDDPDCYADPPMRDALLTASDHFPVSLDLPL